MSAPSPSDSVTRDEALERLQKLEEFVERQARERAQDRKRITELEERLDEKDERLDDLEATLAALRDVATDPTTKEEKIASIVAYAENVAENEDEDAVTVLPTTITGVAGVSRRYAYDLVDAMVREYEWALDPAEQPQYGAVEKDSPQKGVLIDFELVHTDPAAVNKFTTGGR